jgi:hypothetical protein
LLLACRSLSAWSFAADLSPKAGLHEAGLLALSTPVSL